MRINSKIGFYDNAHLHICSICLRLDVSSLVKIQYSEIEPSEKGTHTNESMIFKMFFLYGSSDESSAFYDL